MKGNTVCGGELFDGEQKAHTIEAVAALAEALCSNVALRSLDLSLNDLRTEGAKALAACLPTNVSMQDLRLRWNNIGAQGAVALAESLAMNRSLLTLDLRDNRISKQARQALEAAKSSRDVGTLTILLPQLPHKTTRLRAQPEDDPDRSSSLGVS